MNRVERVIEKMKEAGLDHLLITDPQSIDYLIDYLNYPHERTYVMALSTDGHHQLFFNNLFFVDKELPLPITWFSDTDDSLQLIADYLKGSEYVGVDKNMPARWLLPLMAKCNDVAFGLGGDLVDEVRQVKDEEERQIAYELFSETYKKLKAEQKKQQEILK